VCIITYVKREGEGLKKFIGYVVNGKVVSYKDRLARSEYLEEFFRPHGVRIEVVFGEEPKELL